MTEKKRGVNVVYLTKHAENSNNSHEMDGLFQSKQKWGYTGIT